MSRDRAIGLRYISGLRGRASQTNTKKSREVLQLLNPKQIEVGVQD